MDMCLFLFRESGTGGRTVSTLRIIIRMDNDAFAEAEGQEIARILELLAEEYKERGFALQLRRVHGFQLDAAWTQHNGTAARTFQTHVIPRERLPLFDGNGNTVGEATVLR
jgi:hypothetical protein